MRLKTPTAEAGLIEGPLSNTGFSEESRVVRPGFPELSMLLQRISTRGPNQMPPISTTVVDTNAVQLLTEWITQDAVAFQSFPEWQTTNFGDSHLPQAAADADPDGDGSSNYLEFLVGSSPVVSSASWRISAQIDSGSVRIRFRQIAGRGFEVQTTTNLSDPTSWRILDVAGNSPFFSSTSFDATVEDPLIGTAPRFYRVRVFEQ